MSVTRGFLSTSNITGGSVRTGSGVLKKIQIQDTPSGTTYDATIAIDIDNQGSQTLNLDTMYKTFTSVDRLSNGLDTSTGAATTMTLQLDLPFRSELDITVTNADGFCIFWEEDVF